MSDSVQPHRRQPTRLPLPGILQARTLEWVAISFSNAWKWKVKVKSLSHVRLFATPWTAAYQAPPSMGFSRQEYWSGVPLPSPFHWLASLVIRPIMGPWYHALRRAYTSGVFFPNMHNTSIYSWKKKIGQIQIVKHSTKTSNQDSSKVSKQWKIWKIQEVSQKRQRKYDN